ncbi:leucyl aminopeptidase, partial [Nocardioides lentus]|uniref:leucyl aminopeptidase n=1 Tax=Nocardioides lentus TaxID=338077 RepID=UPI0031D99F12
STTVGAQAVRRAAGVAARRVPNAASVALALPADEPALVRAVTEGWLLGGYTFDRYRSTEDPAGRRPGEVVVLSPGARRQETVAAFEEARTLAAAVTDARDWVNTPAGDLTPPAFAAAVEAAHAELTGGRGAPKVGLRVLDEDELAELGCGGILGVGRGSAAPPRLVELTWEPKGVKDAPHLALVGKGITFDSGGLSIKPAGSMATMKLDMAGAAAVVHATFAIARLGLPVRVSTFVPLAENMVSGTSTRPGDVLHMYGGRTVEVSNTDAEGRLVLADALGRAVEVSPDLVVDVATLTGAMVMALGERVTGVLGTDEVVERVVAASEEAGEPSWHMPIPEEMTDRVRSSKIADLAQADGVRWGGGLFAAAFLREFTGGLPWAHLDIAGTSYNTGEAWGHVTPGGTGAAVATLVDLARAAAR